MSSICAVLVSPPDNTVYYNGAQLSPLIACESCKGSAIDALLLWSVLARTTPGTVSSLWPAVTAKTVSVSPG